MIRRAVLLLGLICLFGLQRIPGQAQTDRYIHASRLGITHIWGGADHLLYVLGLIMLVLLLFFANVAFHVEAGLSGGTAFGARLGVAVPGELSVAGCDDITLAEQVFPSLTTIRQPLAEMAEAARQRRAR